MKFPKSDSVRASALQMALSRLPLPISAILLAMFFARLPVAEGQQNSGDTFFIVASKNQLAYTSLGTPSVNNVGDIVVTTTTGTHKFHRVFLNSAQLNPSNMPGSIPCVLVRDSTFTLSNFPVVNDTGSVVSYVLGNGTKIISRYDPSGIIPESCNELGGYVDTRIAGADPLQNVFPFALLSPIAALDSGDPVKVYFYGERESLIGPYNMRIYGSATEVTNPALETPIAGAPTSFQRWSCTLLHLRMGMLCIEDRVLKVSGYTKATATCLLPRIPRALRPQGFVRQLTVQIQLRLLAPTRPCLFR